MDINQLLTKRNEVANALLERIEKRLDQSDLNQGGEVARLAEAYESLVRNG